MKIIKKFFIAILIIIILSFSIGCGDGCTDCESCGNKNCGSGGYKFYVIHIFSSTDKDVCLYVKRWTESKSGIEVLLDDENYIFVSEGRYLLAKDYCPICGKK